MWKHRKFPYFCKNRNSQIFNLFHPLPPTGEYMAAASCCRFCPSKIGSSGVQIGAWFWAALLQRCCNNCGTVGPGQSRFNAAFFFLDSSSLASTFFCWKLRDLWRLWCRFIEERFSITTTTTTRKFLPRRPLLEAGSGKNYSRVPDSGWNVRTAS